MQVTSPARLERQRQVLHIALTLVGIEQVVEPGVDDRREAPIQARGIKGIRHPEVQATGDFRRELGPLRLRLGDGPVDEVDAEGFETQRGEVNREVAGAAADIQHRASWRIFLEERDHVRLRGSDVPGRRFLVDGLEEREWVRAEAVRVFLSLFGHQAIRKALVPPDRNRTAAWLQSCVTRMADRLQGSEVKRSAAPAP
jgi:hypothetical protein